MNERIREFALLAGRPGYPRGESELQKFAELIVRQCVEVGNQAWLSDNSTVPTFPGKQIKEYFGVE